MRIPHVFHRWSRIWIKPYGIHGAALEQMTCCKCGKIKRRLWEW